MKICKDKNYSTFFILASDEGTACNGVNEVEDKDDESIPTSDIKQSTEEPTEHLHKLEKVRISQHSL